MESGINKIPDSFQSAVTMKPNSNTGMDLRISCLQNRNFLLGKEGYLEKKCSGFFKGWKVIILQFLYIILFGA